MATWPATGDTDWNTKMLAHLAITHDTSGYNKHSVDGTGTRVYTKYLTGTLDADSETDIAHGVTDHDDILSITVLVGDGADSYRLWDYRAATDTTYTYYVIVKATNITITGVSTACQGEKYRIKIDYID